MPKSPFDPLVRDGVLTSEALAAAAESARRQSMSVGWILANENKLPVETVGNSLSAHYRVPFAAVREDLKPLQDVVDKLKAEMCIFCRVVPIGREKNRLVLMMADPGDLPLKDQLQELLGEPFDVRVALPEDIHRLLTGVEPRPAPQPAPIIDLPVELETVGLFEAPESPVVSMLNMILLKCLIREKGEGIRIDSRRSPSAAWLVQGEWRDLSLPEATHQNLVRRLKVMANLDIGNRAKPQEGFFELQFEGGRRRFDVSIEPLGGGDEAARIAPGKS